MIERGSHPDIIVIRHQDSGACNLLSQKVNCAVINAGDGTHEHPTQALLDAYSIREKLRDVTGKNVVLVDDMVDTAGTLTKAADLMMERGALSVRAICTHPILSGSAYERLEASKLEELIVTDSIPLRKESKKLRVITCADLFAEVMYNVHHNQSISNKFIM